MILICVSWNFSMGLTIKVITSWELLVVLPDLVLFIIINAGVKHVGLACVACKQTPILGTRWSCLDCEDHAVNLCTSCYMADEHDIQHVFQRKDSPRVHG